MKLFKYSCGDIEMFYPAKDEQDAYDKRESVYAPFHYLPVVVDELKVEGYEIIVSRHTEGDPSILKNHLATTDKTELKAYLKLHNVEFVPQWSEERLRELALQHYTVA